MPASSQTIRWLRLCQPLVPASSVGACRRLTVLRQMHQVIGLPGGIASPLMPQVREKAGKTKLAGGRGAVGVLLHGLHALLPIAVQGDDGDTLGTGTVLVYDTAQFPAHVASRRHYCVRKGRSYLLPSYSSQGASLSTLRNFVVLLWNVTCRASARRRDIISSTTTCLTSTEVNIMT